MNFLKLWNQNNYSSNPLADKLSYDLLLSSIKSFSIWVIEKASKHKILDEIWIKILWKWISLYVDKNTRISETDSQNNRIIVWWKSIPQDRKNNMIFMDHEYDYEKEILRKYSHELSHIIVYNVWSKNKEFDNFYKNIILKAREFWKWFSLIWSIEFYKNQWINIQATEDITELTNMYISDPKLLLKRLNYLVNIDDNFSYKYKVQKISAKTAEYIYDQIENWVAVFLEM